MVLLTVKSWVPRAEEEVLDVKVGDVMLKNVVALMLVAVARKRLAIVGRSIVVIEFFGANVW